VNLCHIQCILVLLIELLPHLLHAWDNMLSRLLAGLKVSTRMKSQSRPPSCSHARLTGPSLPHAPKLLQASIPWWAHDILDERVVVQVDDAMHLGGAALRRSLNRLGINLTSSFQAPSPDLCNG
jgi:hypothetical protein